MHIDQAKIDILKTGLHSIQSASVMVVGDIMVDRFVYGSVERISPEAPVPVLRIQRENLMLGGAGNVVSNLTGLGTQIHVVCVVGEDETGQIVKDQLSAKNISIDDVLTVENRPTTVKSRFLASNQQIMRSDWETTQEIDQNTQNMLFERIADKIKSVKALILSDYGKGVLTGELTARIIKCARDHNVPVLVDPKGTDFSRYHGAAVITPNLKELSGAFGQQIEKLDAAVSDAAQDVITKSGVDSIVVTRSEDGMSVIARDKNDTFLPPCHLKTQALEVFDVSGAGDTVIATLAAGLAAELTLEDAAMLSNLAGGIVVAKIGTASIRNGELRDRLEELENETDVTGNSPLPRYERLFKGVVANWDEASEWVEKWKAKGLTVGFTNGCFDIIHQGHTTYLNQARAKCDRLVLGLNCDESVSRLKGPERPVNNEQNRATVMAALGAVDLVVLFGQSENEDDKPVELIKVLKPDVFFKGGDYTEDQLPEAPVIRAYGGEVHLMGLVEGESTTGTIEKIRA